MSVNNAKLPNAETSQIEFLYRELCSLTKRLKSQFDEAEKERLESLLGDIHAEIEILKIMGDEPISHQTVKPRKSFRERKLTPKMLELKEQETSQKESKFGKLYEKRKDQAKTARTNLKNECSDKELSNMMDDVEGLEKQVKEAYENVRSHSTPSTEITRKMYSCTAVTEDLMGLMKVRMSEVGLEDFDYNSERAQTSFDARQRLCSLIILIFKDQIYCL